MMSSESETVWRGPLHQDAFEKYVAEYHECNHTSLVIIQPLDKTVEHASHHYWDSIHVHQPQTRWPEMGYKNNKKIKILN